MPNMSYCRFQNTFMDLLDCKNVMDEAFTLEEMDLSKEEARALRDMVEMMRDMIESYEVLVGDKE